MQVNQICVSLRSWRDSYAGERGRSRHITLRARAPKPRVKLDSSPIFSRLRYQNESTRARNPAKARFTYFTKALWNALNLSSYLILCFHHLFFSVLHHLKEQNVNTSYYFSFHKQCILFVSCSLWFVVCLRRKKQPRRDSNSCNPINKQCTLANTSERSNVSMHQWSATSKFIRSSGWKELSFTPSPLPGPYCTGNKAILRNDHKPA